MPDLSQTAADVRLRNTPAARLTHLEAGETIAAGDLVREDSRKAYTTDASSATNANCRGMALNNAETGDRVIIALPGSTIDPGAAATQGILYGVSDAAGGIGPVSERGSGDFITPIGTGTSAGDIKLDINPSGVAQA